MKAADRSTTFRRFPITPTISPAPHWATITTDISSIAVNPDTYYPCPANGRLIPRTLMPTPSLHCDLLARGQL